MKTVEIMEKINLFIDLSVKALECAEKEKKLILDGKMSQWDLGLIQNVVIPEISELLSYANNGKIYFKYRKQTYLQTTYFMTDSINNLFQTDLGKSILELQDVYDIIGAYIGIREAQRSILLITNIIFLVLVSLFGVIGIICKLFGSANYGKVIEILKNLWSFEQIWLFMFVCLIILIITYFLRKKFLDNSFQKIKQDSSELYLIPNTLK